MKKLILVLLLASLLVFSANVLAQAQNTWSIKAGMDMGSSIDIDGNKTDTKIGYTITGEVRNPYRRNLNLGLGVAYQLDRDDDENKDYNFGYTPIYALAEYRMQQSPIYFVGHLGYAGMRFDEDSSIYKNASGGVYYALGAGMDLAQRYEAEVLYTNNSGELEEKYSNNKVDADYSKLTISFGMKF